MSHDGVEALNKLKSLEAQLKAEKERAETLDTKLKNAKVSVVDCRGQFVVICHHL